VLQRTPQPDYGVADSPPLALDIQWDATGVAMPQVALLWEGLVGFEAAPTAVLPSRPDDVLEANFGSWRLEGALLLEFMVADAARTLPRDVPILADPPGFVRYDRVRLTRQFLFQSARSSGSVIWVAGGTRFQFAPGAADPTYRRLIFDFLHGRAGLFARHSGADPATDFTELPMPEVAPPVTGNRASLQLSMASRSLDALHPSWFVADPLRDAQGWPTSLTLPPNLVDAGLVGRDSSDPRHPIFSAIPPLLVLGEAPDAAWVATHAGHPIRNAAVATVNGGVRFRRIDLDRAVASGRQASDEFRRPYPMHQVIVVDPLGRRIAARGPLNGHLYLALDDGVHRITSAARTTPTATAADGSGQLRFATRPAGAKISTVPSPAVTFTVAAATRAYAVLVTAISPDGYLVASRLHPSRVGDLRISNARSAAKKKYHLDRAASSAHIPPTWVDHAVVYGIVMDTAVRHGIAPEFLQAVVMREGVAARFYRSPGATSDPPVEAFNPDAVFPDQLGLDTIADNLDHDATKPPVPDYGLQYLIDNGYIDTALASKANLLVVEHLPVFANEPVRDHWWAQEIKGWQAGIEMVAGELQARLEQMCSTAGRPATDYAEDSRRFLSYVRYNADLTIGNWRVIAQAPLGPALTSFIAAGGVLKPWDFAVNNVPRWPTSNTDSFFGQNDDLKRLRLRWVALRMVAAGDYLEQLGVFR